MLKQISKNTENKRFSKKHSIKPEKKEEKKMQTKRKEKSYLSPNLELVQAGNAKRQNNLQKYKQKVSYPMYAGTTALATYTVILLILNFAAGVSMPILALIFADVAWLAEVIFVVSYQMLQWPSDLLTEKIEKEEEKIQVILTICCLLAVAAIVAMV